MKIYEIRKNDKSMLFKKHLIFIVWINVVSSSDTHTPFLHCLETSYIFLYEIGNKT